MKELSEVQKTLKYKEVFLEKVLEYSKHQEEEIKGIRDYLKYSEEKYNHSKKELLEELDVLYKVINF